MGCLCEKDALPENESPLVQRNTDNQGEDYPQITLPQNQVRSSYYAKEHEEEVEDFPQPIEIYKVAGQSSKQLTVDLSEFKLVKLLGRGSFGKVLLVERKNRFYAMKILKKEEIQKKNQKQHTQFERLILAVTQCTFIVRLHFAFQTKHKLYLVMDFQQGGELFFHLRRSSRFTEQKTRFYAAELLLALEHLHLQKIIYRDLKPENILIGKDGHIKITDFGLSKYGVGCDEKSYSFVGTPEYLAPEILIGQGHNYVCDFWSLGALIYEMLSGSPPFYSRDKTLMFKNRLEKPIDMKSYFSESTTSLLQGLLCNDPRYRLGAGGHNEIKSHPFFREIDWNNLALLRVTPPFIPILENEQDLRYFDPLFTQEAARDTPVHSHAQTMEKYPQFTFERQVSVVENVFSSFQNEQLIATQEP